MEKIGRIAQLEDTNRELPLTGKEVFQAMDGLGRPVWWLRLTVTGLHPRRFGPFETEYDAETCLENFLPDALAALLEIQNRLTCGDQRCVIEDGLANTP